ncbi:unnamed protein product [Peronospora belbahrii]|uniref:Alpha-L-arabinofuranosidase B catalytic domain-containing protein n=1 Tax=Peronospora belbahrii TaxID=622444 RepID=A0AAU9LQH7_9STRA|nr:unnamed protein product [Peronospora belbahrii]
MADMNQGLFGCAETTCPNNFTVNYEFVTAVLKDYSDRFGLMVGDAQSGLLQDIYKGKRPNGYYSMKKQGGIVLSVGDGGKNEGVGVIYEGAIMSGVPEDSIIPSDSTKHRRYGL